ncbi:hypothetical protein ALC62_00856 [Cyphomyrmex costatus]|uniref:Uncharacterized protein n=1 Tax=Cyphomyrmex costatus TaxID=456900 RepID=A0A151IPU0_9HYME|nr:hypothetical protein ALC62_00856 [Cyphomyrmex costatus]
MRAPWLVLILTVILDPLLLLGEAVCHRNDTNLSAAGQRSGETLSRRRRELTFPKGSAFVMTLTLLKAIQLNEPRNWNLDLEFDMIWPIPSQKDLKKVTIKRPSKLKRRHRRELYANLELALDRLNQLTLIVIHFSRNLPGRLCILRTICEAETVLSPQGFSIIEDAIRIILSQRNGKPVRSWTLMNSTMLHARLTAIITVVPGEQIALCLTVHTLTPDDIFTEGLNWGISYDLPNESKPVLEPFLELRNDKHKAKNKHDRYGSAAIANKYGSALNSEWNNNVKQYFVPGKKKYRKSDYYYLQRRHRRDLYNKLEVIMNAMGFDGRTCVLRALCEASQRLMPKGNTLIEEMMRISFSLPLKRVFSFEPEEHRTYTKAHKAGHEGKDCAAMFPGCSFSLIDLALGKYNAPPSDRSGDAVDYAGTFGTEVEPAVDWPRYNMRDTGGAFEIPVRESKREIGLPVETETLHPMRAGIFAVITPLGLRSVIKVRSCWWDEGRD